MRGKKEEKEEGRQEAEIQEGKNNNLIFEKG